MGSCLICGSPNTVRSHILPKSFVRRIRGNEPHATAGDKRRNGIEYTQGGRFDDNILCAEHEASLAAADDYALRFCRDLLPKARSSASGQALEIPNPQPRLLQTFAYACVWRQAVSADGVRHGLTLGPFKQKLEEHLFHRSPHDLLTTVSRSNFRCPKGQRIEIGLYPYKARLLGANIYHFQVGGFDFWLKLDQRPYEGKLDWELVSVLNDPLVCVEMDPRPIQDVPMLQPIFKNMLRRRGST